MPELKPVSQEDLEAKPTRRLVKTWQDPELIRRMDELIIASRGAYADRNDFIAEALRDRVEADAEGLPAEAGNGDGPSISSQEADQVAVTPAAPAGSPTFGDWLGEEVPTAPASTTTATIFGLHNRDYPTLWAADWLGRLTAAADLPLSWEHLIGEITERAWGFADQLQAADLDRPRGAKVAAGFPTNRKKPDAVEARFRDHFLGLVDKRGPRGPLFIFGIAGVYSGDAVALTEAGLQLVIALQEAGVADGPPFGAAAWTAFSAHLEEHTPAELETWRKVLAIIGDKPDRPTLINRCDWWKGATADTNAMGYLARGREWGLVELALSDGHYALTERGTDEIKKKRKGATPSG